jgi:hypothetical protein
MATSSLSSDKKRGIAAESQTSPPPPPAKRIKTHECKNTQTPFVFVCEVCDKPMGVADARIVVTAPDEPVNVVCYACCKKEKKSNAYLYFSLSICTE